MNDRQAGWLKASTGLSASFESRSPTMSGAGPYSTQPSAPLCRLLDHRTPDHSTLTSAPFRPTEPTLRESCTSPSVRCAIHPLWISVPDHLIQNRARCNQPHATIHLTVGYTATDP